MMHLSSFGNVSLFVTPYTYSDMSASRGHKTSWQSDAFLKKSFKNLPWLTFSKRCYLQKIFLATFCKILSPRNHFQNK